MRYDISKFPVNEEDTQLKDEKGKLTTYRDVFIKALASDMDQNGQPVRGEEKFKRYDLYLKVKKTQAILEDITPAEADYLEQACLVFPSVVAGQVRDFLRNPAPAPPLELVGRG
jgi:hypothetical protein